VFVRTTELCSGGDTYTAGAAAAAPYPKMGQHAISIASPTFPAGPQIPPNLTYRRPAMAKGLHFGSLINIKLLNFKFF